VLGSAIGTSFVDRVVGPDAVKAANGSDADIAKLAFDRLASAGQSFRRDGKALDKSDANVAEIAKIVHEFRDARLPMWQSLGLLQG
jgi:hypothetical protein